MGFHWCGNPFHDVPYNILVIVALMPEYLPFLGILAIKARHALKRESHLNSVKDIYWC